MLEKGITAQFIKLNIKVEIGAIINIILLALLGIIVSFSNNFNPSANGCNKPNIPITFGPRLFWIEAKTFR